MKEKTFSRNLYTQQQKDIVPKQQQQNTKLAKLQAEIALKMQQEEQRVLPVLVQTNR